MTSSFPRKHGSRRDDRSRSSARARVGCSARLGKLARNKLARNPRPSHLTHLCHHWLNLQVLGPCISVHIHTACVQLKPNECITSLKNSKLRPRVEWGWRWKGALGPSVLHYHRLSLGLQHAGAFPLPSCMLWDVPCMPYHLDGSHSQPPSSPSYCRHCSSYEQGAGRAGD